MIERITSHQHKTTTRIFTPVGGGQLQRKCICDQNHIAGNVRAECHQTRLYSQHRATNRAKLTTALPTVREGLRSPGKPINPTTRTFMEPLFGHDFSQVRVHDDEFAHRATSALGLEACAFRNHIYFGHTRWQPETAKGRELLQHELGHVSRGDSYSDTIEGWSSSGHRTITRQALEGDTRFSEFAKTLLANTAPILDYNRPQILQDMVSFWSGEHLYRAPLGMVAGAIIGGVTPPEQGTRLGGVQISGALPQAILGTGLIPTIPVSERARGREGQERAELQHTRVTQELANHGEDQPTRNEARMNEYTDQGIATANRCDMHNGLVQLGYALHVAQDRGSHGDGYTADYVQNRPHSQIDDMSANPDGLAAAIRNSRTILDRFFNGLREFKKRSLADPLALQHTRPPVVETILAPPATMPAPPSVGPETGPQPGGLNLLTIRF